MVADGSVNTGAAGVAIRAITGVGAGAATDQQVVGLAKSDGTLEAATAAGSIAVQSRVQALALTVGSISTATGTVTAGIDIANAGTVTLGVYGTFVGAVLNFEASPDNVNWFPILGQRTDSYETEITTPTFSLTAQARAWDIPLPGFAYFRCRASALASGTVNVIVIPAVNAFEVAPSVGLAAAPMMEINAVATATGVMFTQDCAAYQSVRVQLVATVAWSNVTVQFEVSNDNANWQGVMLNQTSSGGSGLTNVNFAGLFTGNINARYFRLRVSNYTSGTVTAIVDFSAQSVGAAFGTATMNNFTGNVALTDGFANPTTGHVAADQFAYNGTTWDRVRNNQATVTGDSGTKTVTFNGATQTNMNYRGGSVVIIVGTVSGTTPTMTVKMQASADGGTNWYDIPGATTAALTATGTYVISCYPAATPVAGTATTGSVAAVSQPMPRTWRLVYTIGGTSPSFALTSATMAYVL